eukprot:scaffold72998_cov65-Phaeocystis_antarctica.AAC.3
MAGAHALQHSPSNDERANALYAAPLNLCCESHGMVHGVMSVFMSIHSLTLYPITTVNVLLSLCLEKRAPPPQWARAVGTSNAPSGHTDLALKRVRSA